MNQKIVKSGKRKTSIAKAILGGGNGKVTVNRKDYKTLDFFRRLKMEEPIRIAEKVLGKLNFDVEISVKGGGEKSQIEAARLALARAINESAKNKELTDSFIAYDRNLLVADVRRKEMYKPGDSKARRSRQKSFR